MHFNDAYRFMNWLLTALRVHGLTTQNPNVVWLLIER